MTISLTVYAMFGEGKSYQQIAKATGMTRQRVQQMCKPSAQLFDMVKRRAGNKCERCGIEPRNPHIHHVSREGLPLSNTTANLAKLLYLCPSCHTKQHVKEDRKTKPQKAQREEPYAIVDEMVTLDCVRCGYVWIPRQENLPKVCPKCKHQGWNEKKSEAA